MKTLLSNILIMVLPAVSTALESEGPIKQQIVNNVIKSLKRSMLKQKIIALLAALAVLSVIGCFVNKNTSMVITAPIEEQNLASMYTSSSCTYSVLGVLGPFGEASAMRAAEKGRLTKVYMVDHYSQNFLIVQRNCVRVHGTAN